MKVPPFVRLVIGSGNFPTLVDAFRTTAAAVLALLLADLLRLPNGYWAAISCLIVVLSAAGSEWAVSVQRCVGTAMGAATGAAAVHCLGGGFVAFGLAVLAIGVLCWAARVDRAAFRYGSIAAAIVILVPHQEGAGRVALHRFVEVSLGIAVGLATATAWPRRPGPKVP
jgi:uncharacterized membrane protein YccC